MTQQKKFKPFKQKFWNFHEFFIGAMLCKLFQFWYMFVGLINLFHVIKMVTSDILKIFFKLFLLSETFRY